MTDKEFRELLDKLANTPEIEVPVPGMLPDGWEMGPFGPMQTRSAAAAIKLLMEHKL
jgi:hypothetical protein